MKTLIAAAFGAALVLAAAPASAGSYYGGHGYGHGYSGGYGHDYSYGYKPHAYYGGHHCYLKKVKVFGHYGWTWKFVKHCY